MQRVVLASGNPGKLRELHAMLEPLGLDVVPQSDFDIEGAEETGQSFVENAILKARHAAERSGLPAIADDSGIMVDALGGAPGVYSARYAGEGASDAANLELLLANLRGVPDAERGARFVCLAVFMTEPADACPIVCEGVWRGRIVHAPRGENGFGYDPVFFVEAHGCTSAELPPERKNRVSHRALAMRALVERLRVR